MAKRANNEGSVFYRKPTDKRPGGWVAVLNLGVVDGKRKRLTIYGKTQAEVIEKRDAAKAAVRQGRPVAVDRRETVAAYLRWWVDEVERGRVANGKIRDTTVDTYDDLIQRYVLPTLGAKKIADLSVGDVHGFMRSLEKANGSRKALAASSRRQVRAVLNVAMKDAVRFGKITTNPVAATDAPAKTGAKLKDALTLAEAKVLLAAVKGDPMEALVTVALTVGLRRGEALALRWEDIDLDAGTLTVNGTLKRRVGVRKGVEGAGIVVNAPKTASGCRTVPLPVVCVDALKAHKARQAREQMSPWVFIGKRGKPWDPSWVTYRFQKITTGAGLGKRRFHALRHSAATLQLAAGVPLAIISESLGHAGYAITKDVYAGVSVELMREGAAAMDRVLTL